MVFIGFGIWSLYDLIWIMNSFFFFVFIKEKKLFKNFSKFKKLFIDINYFIIINLLY